MGYASLAELKTFLGISDTNDDANLTLALEAATTHIDRLANRTFGQTVQTRTFAATDPHSLLVGDLVSVSALATDDDGDGIYETTWSQSDYELRRYGFVRPYTRIAAIARTFPSHYGRRTGIEVTGTWGWPVVPEDVRFAALILAARLFKRKDSPEGVLGFSEFGTVRLSPHDRDVMALLAPYKRLAVA